MLPFWLTCLVAVSFACSGLMHADSPSSDLTAPASREHKLALDPARFGGVPADDGRAAAFAAYWALVLEVAATQGVQVKSARLPLRERRRRVVFLDTPAFDLRRANLALRERTRFRLGVPEERVEVALKYRSPSREEAARADTTASAGRQETELEEDVGYAPEAPDRLRRVYSQRTRLKTREPPGVTVGQVAEIFPALGRLGLPADAPLGPVHGRVIDERSVKPGTLRFGDTLKAEADLTLWYSADGTPLTAEFSFSHRLAGRDQGPGSPSARALAFFVALGDQSVGWLAPGGQSKTSTTYDHAPPSGEVTP